MKLTVGQDVGTYLFTPGTAGAGTVALTLPYVLRQEQVILITNTTDGIILYNFADAGSRATISNNVITLANDTASMSASDALQIVISVATEETVYEIEPLTESFTYDTNLAQVFGSQAANDNGNIKTKGLFQVQRANGILRVAQDEFSVPCDGFQTAAIQLSGTWAGTVSFEANANGGDYVAINGFALNGSSPITSSTANGTFRFNVSALTRIRVRVTAYTSGAVTVATVLSAGEAIINTGNVQRVQGSQGQDIAQRATSFEANTYDTNLANVLGNVALWRNGFTGLEFPAVPTVNPAQPASYAATQFSRWPQVFPRLRVEVGGSQKLPLTQEANTNNLVISNPMAISLLEQMLMQLTLFNQNYSTVNNLPLPAGQTEIR